MNKQYFGTDGIRGTVGQGVITPEFMLKLGWAAGKVFSSGEGRQRILIGKDTRISGYMFESALEAGLSAAGVDVMLLGPMPTPAIAYLTRTYRAAAGIVISASHNPYYDNGIKFFCTEGKKLPDEVELRIEHYLGQVMDTVHSDLIGKTRKLEDARGRYIEFCKSTFPRTLSLHGLRIVVDCANGATYAPGPAVFEELGAEVIPIGVSPNGLNINLGCGSTDPQALQEKVRELRADLGIAFDGDGDRLLMVDSQGELVDGDELLYIIARGRQQSGELDGGVVGTLMSNYGLELALQQLGVEFVRAKVGDRYVMEQLTERRWQLGGESSGHIVCLDKTTTGDGIVSALQVLTVMVGQDKSLDELRAGMRKMPQTMINVKLPEKRDVVSLPQVQDAVQSVEAHLGSRGRVLLRPSGTEPLIRVMVEGDDADEVAGLCRQIAAEVEAAIGA
ncbi:MAG: phosphoglucosamine mutase [Pseudomonadales bacterium]|nr:phosphoglucosamine mutase [Pseudomonadales bacterium]